MYKDNLLLFKINCAQHLDYELHNTFHPQRVTNYDQVWDQRWKPRSNARLANKTQFQFIEANSLVVSFPVPA